MQLYAKKIPVFCHFRSCAKKSTSYKSRKNTKNSWKPTDNAVKRTIVLCFEHLVQWQFWCLQIRFKWSFRNVINRIQRQRYFVIHGNGVTHWLHIQPFCNRRKTFAQNIGIIHTLILFIKSNPNTEAQVATHGLRPHDFRTGVGNCIIIILRLL